MIKNLVFIVLLMMTSSIGKADRVNYVRIQELKATAYPAHVELAWNNQEGFIYEIYRSVGDSDNFVKTGMTDKSCYMDFFGNQVQRDERYLYRVIPKGMSVQDENALKFQIAVLVVPSSDEALVDMTQRYTTRYFYDFAQPQTGMARERSNNSAGDIVTTGGTGFGIMALIAGAEREYITGEQAFSKIEKIVAFLEKAERFHGAWAHWYDANTGKVFNFSKFDDGGDLVETAFLLQGLLTAREYYKSGSSEHKRLSGRITRLWEAVEWNWYTRGTDSLYWHWSKNYGFRMNHRIKGFDETLITYILAASSPTHPIKRSVYDGCYTQSPYFLNGKSYYGIKLDLGMEYGGPLFFTHYSFLGLNPNGLSDMYTNYFERNRAHALIHRAYAIDNPYKHEGYGENCWGFTSSDDPLAGYSSHQPGTAEDNGTITPTAGLASIVYTPQESLALLRHLYLDRGREIFGRYGFYDSFNPSLVEGQQVVRCYLAIDQGPIAVMLENYRSGLIWNLFMQNKEIKKGLEKLGFNSR